MLDSGSVSMQSACFDKEQQGAADVLLVENDYC
jgi:hypothetical protein